MKWLDLPPVWLLGLVVLAGFQARFLPMGLTFAHPILKLLAGVLLVGGVALMLMAVAQFRRYRTIVIPHRVPDHMITTGIFAHSRNPIYLADAIFLTAAVLWLGSVPAATLIPVFVWIITRRFIRPEESRLKRKFRADFDAYAQLTPRWI